MIFWVPGEKEKVLEGAGSSVLCPILNDGKNTVHFDAIQEGIGKQAQAEKATNKD